MVNFVHLHFAQNKIVTLIWIVNTEIAEKPFSDRQMVHLVQVAAVFTPPHATGANDKSLALAIQSGFGLAC